MPNGGLLTLPAVWASLRSHKKAVAVTLPIAIPAALLAIGLSLPVPTTYAILVWTSIQYALTDDLHLPAWFALLDECLLLLLTLSWISRKLLTDGKIRLCPSVTIPVVLFLAVGISSMILNSAPVGPALFGIRQHLQYALIFYAVINLDLTEQVRRRLVLLVLFIAFLQVPLVMLQWKLAGAEFIERAETAPDLLRGTMGSGGGNALGYFLLLAAAIVLALYHTGATRYGASLILASVIVLVPFVLSGSRISLPIFGFFLAWLFGRRLFARPRDFVVASLLATLVGGGVYYYVEHVLAEGAATFSLEVNLHSEMDPANVGRIAYYPISWDVLHKYAASPWIGTGPATYFSLAGRRFNPPLAEMYNYHLSGAPVSSGILGTGVEYGYLGLLTFYGIILAFFRIARRVWRTTSDPFWEGVARGYFAALLLFAIAPLIMNIWEFQVFAFYVWMFPAVLYVHQRDHALKRRRRGRTFLLGEA